MANSEFRIELSPVQGKPGCSYSSTNGSVCCNWLTELVFCALQLIKSSEQTGKKGRCLVHLTRIAPSSIIAMVQGMRSKNHICSWKFYFFLYAHLPTTRTKLCFQKSRRSSLTSVPFCVASDTQDTCVLIVHFAALHVSKPLAVFLLSLSQFRRTFALWASRKVLDGLDRLVTTRPTSLNRSELLVSDS